MDKYRLHKRGIMLYREVHVRYAVCLRYWTPPQWLIGGGGQGGYPQLFLLVIFFLILWMCIYQGCVSQQSLACRALTIFIQNILG